MMVTALYWLCIVFATCALLVMVGAVFVLAAFTLGQLRRCRR